MEKYSSEFKDKILKCMNEKARNENAVSLQRCTVSQKIRFDYAGGDRPFMEYEELDINLDNCETVMDELIVTTDEFQHPVKNMNSSEYRDDLYYECVREVGKQAK